MKKKKKKSLKKTKHAANKMSEFFTEGINCVFQLLHWLDYSICIVAEPLNVMLTTFVKSYITDQSESVTPREKYKQFNKLDQLFQNV